MPGKRAAALRIRSWAERRPNGPVSSLPIARRLSESGGAILLRRPSASGWRTQRRFREGPCRRSALRSERVGSVGHENPIRSKHVDFVVCAPDTLKPLAAVELDDSSHGRSDRKDRDEFLGEAFEAAGLPLLRFTAKRHYKPGAIAADLESVLAGKDPVDSLPGRPERGTGAPNCPKCSLPMIVKTAGRGLRAGRPFYGCPNFPKCRETAPITQ